MGRIAPSSGALKGGTHLREEANEKWAGVLGEKLRGLSRGLLPAEEKRALGFSNHQIRLPGTVHPSNVSQSMYGRPRPFCSGSASLNIFSWGVLESLGTPRCLFGHGSALQLWLLFSASIPLV